MRRLGSEMFTPSGVNTSCIRFTSSSKYGIVAGAEAEQADLVVAGVAVAFQGGLHDGLDRADAQRPLDDGRLAEAALPGAAAHDLDGDAVVRRLRRTARPACVGSGMASKSWLMVQAMISRGTSVRVRFMAARVPSAWYSGS